MIKARKKLTREPTHVPLKVIDELKESLGRTRRVMSGIRREMAMAEKQLNRLSGWRRSRQWHPN